MVEDMWEKGLGSAFWDFKPWPHFTDRGVRNAGPLPWSSAPYFFRFVLEIKRQQEFRKSTF
jgi:hypothetical protein